MLLNPWIKQKSTDFSLFQSTPKAPFKGAFFWVLMIPDRLVLRTIERFEGYLLFYSDV